MGGTIVTEEDLKNRTRSFALRVIKLVNSLPRSQTGKVLGNQLLRAGTSVGANYRAACRARSRADFVSKLGIVEEEVDESAYWMEIIVDAGLMDHERLHNLLQEANELTAITTASIRTIKQGSNPNSKI